MIVRIALFVALVLTVACGTARKKETESTLKEINFHGNVHKPYCGGARPNPTIAAGYYEPMKFEKFNILKGKSFTEGMEIYKEITLDVEGNAVFSLPIGDYMLIRADKYLSLEAFMMKNAPMDDKNYKIKGDDCFKTWKNTPEMYFRVVNDTSIELLQKAKCWVGINECIEYVGPPAP
jgi:hypothetical protein